VLRQVLSMIGNINFSHIVPFTPSMFEGRTAVI
jgi:hypothetical protein